MNQLEQFREQCASICDEAKKNISPDYIIGEDVRNAGIACCENIAKRIRALQLPEVNQEPVAWLRHRFAQSLDTNGYCDGHEWLEVCNEGEQGDDKTPAFPVYDLPTDAEALRKENEKLNALLLATNSDLMNALYDIERLKEEKKSLQNQVNEFEMKLAKERAK